MAVMTGKCMCAGRRQRLAHHVLERYLNWKPHVDMQLLRPFHLDGKMNFSGRIDNDVFDENSTNEELHLADNEFKRQLNSIKTAAFHDTFEPSKEVTLQKAFDTGYELVYKYFRSISMLEGIYDSVYNLYLQTKPEGETIEDIKSQFSCMYSDLFENFNNRIDQDVRERICFHEEYQPRHIVPSNDLIVRFNTTRHTILNLCLKACLTHLYPVVENVQLLI